LAIRGLGLAPAACWVIEDSLNGIKAAKHAGCVALAITTSFDDHALMMEGADWTFSHFEELRTMLEMREFAEKG
jgi:beta-phosphoglucomutase